MATWRTARQIEAGQEVDDEHRGDHDERHESEVLIGSQSWPSVKTEYVPPRRRPPAPGDGLLTETGVVLHVT